MILDGFNIKQFSNFDISNKSLILKISATIALIAIANVIKFSLREYIGDGVPFLIFFTFIILTGFFIGFWYAVTCTLIFGIVGDMYFMLPYGAIYQPEVIKLCIFFIEGICISALSNAFRKTLRETQKAKDNFKLLISKSNDGLARISENGKILYLSPSVQAITGYTKEELESGGFNIFPEEKDRDVIVTEFFKVLREEKNGILFTHRYKNAEGEIRWMETIFTNYLQVEGLNAIIVNFRDVTERVEADIRKNDFVGVAAHEIRNPLSVIGLSSGLLNEATKTNDSALIIKVSEIIRANVNKVVTLIDELMNFSSFESSLKNLHCTNFCIDVAVKNSIAAFNSNYKNTVLRTGETMLEVCADRIRIEQVIVNFLSNASKYSDAHADIILQSTVDGECVTIAITDKGVGIPEKEIDLLFNKFHRVKANNVKAKGYGLGLYICAEIIKAHNGKIGVQSKINEGSRFWFSLPAVNKAYAISEKNVSLDMA